MHIYLSRDSPTNTTFVNEHGQAIYKVSTPFQLKNKVSTISKVVPNGGTDCQDRYEVFAEIRWQVVEPTMFTLHGNTVPMKEFFRATHFRRFYTFSVNGQTYRWTMASSGAKLNLVGDLDVLTPVIKFRRRAFFGKSRPASIEIFPLGQDIIEVIIATFVWIEQVRRDRE